MLNGADMAPAPLFKPTLRCSDFWGFGKTLASFSGLPSRGGDGAPRRRLGASKVRPRGPMTQARTPVGEDRLEGRCLSLRRDPSNVGACASPALHQPIRSPGLGPG